MAFSPDFLDEIRARIGVGEVVARHVQLKRAGRELTGLCPFHNEKSPSFTVSEEKGFFHCFGCGAHGDVIGFVMRHEGLSFPETVERLAGDAGLEVPKASPEERDAARRTASLHEVMERACRFFEAELKGPRGKTAREYLRGRGIDDDIIARFRVGYAPDSRGALRTALVDPARPEPLLVEAGLLIRPDEGTPYDRFRGRVIFPITDRRGRVIAFGGRVLGDGKPKYLNSPETPLFNKGRVLYGMATARQAARETGRVIVTEGYTDVIALTRAGFPEAVAPLGTALTENHLFALWRMAPEPILCFDGDEAGRRATFRAAERALPLLEPGRSLEFVTLPAGRDPDSLLASGGAGAVDACLRNRRSLADIVWEICTQGRRLDTPERLAGLKSAYKAIVGRIDDRTVSRAYDDDFWRRFQAVSGRRQGEGRHAKGANKANVHGAVKLPLGAGPEALKRHGPRFILATLLRHPPLIGEYCERLVELNISEQKLDKLLQEILLLAPAASGLDPEGLRRQLSEVDAEVADSLLCADIYAQWHYARPGSTIEAARYGIENALAGLTLPSLEAELAAAEMALANDPSEANTLRIHNLIEALQGLSGGEDFAALDDSDAVAVDRQRGQEA